MRDALLIVMLAALFVLGFIPVVKFSNFLKKNRRYVLEGSEQKKRRKGKQGRLLDEFDDSGVLFFGPDEGEPKTEAEERGL